MRMLSLLKSKFQSVKYKIEADRRFSERKKIIAEYLTPDPMKPEVEVSSQYKHLVDELRQNGIIKIEGFEAIADYVNATYFESVENVSSIASKWHKLGITKRGMSTGRSVQMDISFDDQDLFPLFFSPDLLGIVYNYYKRQPYFRNLPVLIKVDFKENQKIDIQGKFHLDGGLNQVSYMLLLNDITQDDTHMEYAVGTNNLEPPKNIYRYSWDDKEIEEKHSLYHLVGKKGTLYVFAAGNGYHRAVYKPGSTRKILHVNFTTGHSICYGKERPEADFGFLDNKPSFVKKVVEKLVD